MSDALNLTDRQIELLLTVITVDGWYVDDDTLVDAGALKAAAMVWGRSDYDGLMICVTPAGINAMLARGLIAKETNPERYHEWKRLGARPYSSPEED